MPSTRRLDVVRADARASTVWPKVHDAGGGALRHPRDAEVVGVEDRDGVGRQVDDHLGLRLLGGVDAAELAGVGESRP